MQINELNAYSVDGSALGKSPPIWTPAASCLLLSHADNPKIKNPCKLFVYKDFAFVGPSLALSLAVRRGNEHLRAPERLSARYGITKRCPPIRCLHNRIELHLACLVLFYDIKVIVFSKKSNCRYLGAQVYEMQPTDLTVAGCGVCMMLPGTNAPARNGSSFYSHISLFQ